MHTYPRHKQTSNGGAAMNIILGDSIVSCYVDAASFLGVILLLILSERTLRQKNKSLRLYFMLCLMIAVTSVICFVFNAMDGHTEPWSHTVALISRTLWEFCVLVIIVLWLAFVDHKLFRDFRKWTFVRMIRDLPLFVFPVLLIINSFTGIVFTIAEDNRLRPHFLFYIIMVTNFLIFLSTAVAVRLFDRRSSKFRFLRVSPMIISVFAAIIPQFFTPFNTGIIGFTIGAVMLYFPIADENRFLDEESGLYNRDFMAFLLDMALTGKCDVRSALVLEIDGNLSAGFEILHSVLQRVGDVIRMDEKEFLMLSGLESRSELQLLSTHVEEAVAKYNSEYPQEKVRISVRCRIHAEGEDEFTFLRSVVEEKDTGDPVRGVVSMISELDRLDNELKLAGDIQINMLPMKFPAFPDRTEFDLYASMTPAKEVGGDFYDFFLIDNDHLGLVIADVSGKGIPAALFMMVSKTLIKNQLMSGYDPAAALEHVNLQLCERNSASMFVTVWAAVLEISTGKGLACNAGHENPALRRTGSNFELLKYKHGIFIGVSKKAKYINREFELHPGDSIFVYTDGVPEANNTSEEMFKEERLIATLNQNPDLSPEELIHRMHDAVNLFAGGAEQFDDITMLCVKYNGTQEMEKE